MLTLQGREVPKEMSYLQCKVCQKQFPKYDQRGFRNAGYTAHQNRCIEREYLSIHPNIEQQQPAINRQRVLLPAPTLHGNESSPASSLNRDNNTLYNAIPTTEELLDTANAPLNQPVIAPAGGLFPITHCEYCTPECGLHQVSCRVIVEIVNPDI